MDRRRPVTRKTPIPGRPELTVAEQRRLISTRSKEFDIQGVYKYGYRNKEDISNLPPSTLVLGSQNMLTNAAELIGVRQGYVLDGDAGNQNTYGIDSNYDFETRVGAIQNLRKWGPNLEVRYVNPVTSAVSWISLLATLNPDKVANFTNFWDSITELKEICLFVNGDSMLYAWSGAVGSFASSSPSQSNIITGLTLNAGGSSYFPGDTLNISTGSGATAVVLATDSGGVIQAITLSNPGSGYSTGTGVATTGGNGTGATVNITSVGTGGSITLSGTKTLSQLGFFDNAVDSSLFKLVINGISYSYTSVAGMTFYGVTPDPSLATIAVGDAVIQPTYNFNVAKKNITGMPATFTLDLISTLENQIWYGSLTDNSIYVSKTGSYLNVSFSSPARLPAEGALIVIDAAPVAFSPQAGEMYISAGRSQWWISQKNQQTISVSGVAVPTETLYASRLKTAFNQGAQSQALTGRYKNSLVFVSNEPIINALGLVQNIQQDPQVVNMSDPIKYDIDAYDFTGGSIIYDNYYIYVAIPVNGVVRMYNVKKNYWEAPQTIPISRFYHTSDGALHGHSGLTNESYTLFTGYNDNGNPISTVAAFPYVSQQGGAAFQKKNFNQIYTEGYISSNTLLMVTINYDFGGFSGSYTTIISGADLSIIFNKVTDGSLGRNPLGTEPLGTILNIPNAPAEPKFRVINTMPRQNFFEYQIVYSTDDVDQNFTLLRFGPAIGADSALPSEIMQ